MSRIGSLPIAVPSGVDVAIDGSLVTVKGPKGTLSHAVADPITVEKTDGVLEVKRPDDHRISKSLHGLTRTLVDNMVVGVTTGYEKKLEIVGVGYRVLSKGPTVCSSSSVTRTRSRSRRLRASRSPSTAPPAWVSRASTSSSSAKPPPTSASCASPSPTRARVFVTPASTSAARSERLVSDMAISLKNRKHTAARTASRLRRQMRGRKKGRGRASARAWSSPARASTSRCRSSTTWSAGRSRPPRPWRATCAPTMATRLPRPRRSAARCRARQGSGVQGVVFDRAGNKYHGRIAALADGAREGGLTF